jgi:glycosyltransferase involved in cell wall biosynthesis
LVIGGAEKALIALLETIDYSKYEVDLFLYVHKGEYMINIPKEVNLLPEISTYAYLNKSILETLSHNLISALVRLLSKLRYLWHPVQQDDYSIYDEIDRWGARLLPKIQPKEEYDLCISFLANHRIEKKKIRAKKYIAWIHTDYSTITFDKERSFSGWELFDHIISISESVTQGFAYVYPTLKDKLLLIENGISPSTIQSQADSSDVSQEIKGKIKILSVGRFCTQKNFVGAVEIMSELCKLRDDVTWYIIGYGSEEQVIRAKIKEYNLQDKFIILGKKDNPYPYMKACDLYVQPSLYEGKCIAVMEAQSLGKPVAITNYATAHGQIEDGIDGQIIPFNPQQAAQALHQLLSSPQTMQTYSKHCREKNYNYDLTNLYKLI